MRVPQSDELSAVLKLMGSDESVCMAGHDAINIFTAGRARGHNGPIFIILEEFGEESSRSSFTPVLMLVVGPTGKGSDTFFSLSSFKVQIVSMELGERLLDERSPEGIVITEFGENSGFFTICSLDRKPVINDNSGWESETVEFEAVDSCSVLLVFFVEEDLLDTAWHLGKRSAGSQEPAVSDETLVDVTGDDARSEQSRIRESFGGTFPCDMFSCQVDGVLMLIFVEIFPEERILVALEVLVCVLRGLFDETKEIVNLANRHFMGAQASSFVEDFSLDLGEDVLLGHGGR